MHIWSPLGLGFTRQDRTMTRVLIAAAAMLLPATAAAQITWVVCDDAPAGARCGTLHVAESRDAPGGRMIGVAFVILPAAGSVSEGDPVLVLLGGPGDAGVERVRGIANALAALNRARDLVIVDQRGTGRSAALRCVYGDDNELQAYLDAFLPLRATQECAARLGATADLARYRTRDFVADLEALRTALGVARWNLHGTSYGTRVALHYMHRHPGSVRAAVLVGVVPPELAMPLTLGRDADGALDKLAADCVADAACRRVFPHFSAEVDSVAQRLARAPAAVEIMHPSTSRPVTLTLSRGTFGETLRTMMYSPAGASALPLAVHEAFRGDYRAIVMAALANRRSLARSGAAGLYLAVTCAEDVARVDTAAAELSNRATTMGTARMRQHIHACRSWPVRPDGEEWPDATPVHLPVLLIVGDADPATPPHWAETALRSLRNGRLLVVPQGGHGFNGMRGADCIMRVQAAFIAAPVPDALDAGCVTAMRRPPFVLRR
jgi:pimeloyl-ACP methyl ester carboxylesterase